MYIFWMQASFLGKQILYRSKDITYVDGCTMIPL